MAKRRTYDEVRGRGDTDRRQREAEGETRRAGNTLCAHSYEFPAIKYHSKIARRNSIFVKWRLDAPVTDPRCIRAHSSKPRYYGVRRSFEIWMDASPIPSRKPYDSNFYSQIRTYYPCTLANDASKRDKYLEIHQRRYFSCQRKGKIFSLSLLRSKRVDTSPVDSFFDPSDFFPSWFTAVLPCIVLPSLLSLAPLGGFACGSSTVSLVE